MSELQNIVQTATAERQDNSKSPCLSELPFSKFDSPWPLHSLLTYGYRKHSAGTEVRAGGDSYLSLSLFDLKKKPSISQPQH